MKQTKAKDLKKGDIFCKALKVQNRVSYKVLRPLKDNVLEVVNRNTGENETMIINENKYLIYLRNE